jgi:hypothetical protein
MPALQETPHQPRQIKTAKVVLAGQLNSRTRGACEELACPTFMPDRSYRSCRPAKSQSGLMCSGRVRRHSHRRARSAPPCGASRGPRASWVRVPRQIITRTARKVFSEKGKFFPPGSSRTGPYGSQRPFKHQSPVRAAAWPLPLSLHRLNHTRRSPLGPDRARQVLRLNSVR